MAPSLLTLPWEVRDKILKLALSELAVRCCGCEVNDFGLKTIIVFHPKRPTPTQAKFKLLTVNKQLYSETKSLPKPIPVYCFCDYDCHYEWVLGEARQGSYARGSGSADNGRNQARIVEMRRAAIWNHKKQMDSSLASTSDSASVQKTNAKVSRITVMNVTRRMKTNLYEEVELLSAEVKKCGTSMLDDSVRVELRFEVSRRK